MRPADEAVLDLLATHELWLTAPAVAKNTSYSTGYIRKVLKEHVSEGFVQIDDNGGDPFYRITAEGRIRLRGLNNSERTEQ